MMTWDDEVFHIRGNKPTDEQLQARIRWVELLRSGKYSQTTGVLARANSLDRCCLGVACDPVVTGITLESEVRNTDSEIPYLVFHTTPYVDESPFMEGAVLPHEIREALGLRRHSLSVVVEEPTEGISGTIMPLIYLNDSGDYTFEDIADLIEKNHITPWLEESVDA